MTINFLFQGPIISKGRTFAEYGGSNVVYNSVSSLISLSNALRDYGYRTFLSIWKSELPLLSDSEKESLKFSFTEIIFLDDPSSSLVHIDQINSCSGVLGNKAYHLYGMNQSLLYLFQNKFVGIDDIIFRSRTDITFDVQLMHEFIDSNLSQINNDFFVLQYLKNRLHLVSRFFTWW